MSSKPLCGLDLFSLFRLKQNNHNNVSFPQSSVFRLVLVRHTEPLTRDSYNFTEGRKKWTHFRCNRTDPHFHAESPALGSTATTVLPQPSRGMGATGSRLSSETWHRPRLTHLQMNKNKQNKTSPRLYRNRRLHQIVLTLLLIKVAIYLKPLLEYMSIENKTST